MLGQSGWVRKLKQPAAWWEQRTELSLIRLCLRYTWISGMFFLPHTKAYGKAKCEVTKRRKEASKGSRGSLRFAELRSQVSWYLPQGPVKPLFL